MSFGKMFAGFGPAASQAGMQAANLAKLPTPAKIPMPTFTPQDLLNDINKSKGGLLDRIWGKMDKSKMRETGVGLINQSLQQQGQPGPTIAPFQPGGGGGMQMGGGTPQLVALAQQLGLNRVL